MKPSCLFLSILLGLYLGVHNGHLALWSSNAAVPIEVFPYPASLYPYADREALEQGIPVRSQQELTRLLEDYFS